MPVVSPRLSSVLLTSYGLAVPPPYPLGSTDLTEQLTGQESTLTRYYQGSKGYKSAAE